MPRGLGSRIGAKLVLLAIVRGLAPAIAYPDAGAGERKAQLCLFCHEPNNPMAYLPTLEGQTREYLHPIRGSFKLDSQKVALGGAKARDLECDTCHRSDFSGENWGSGPIRT